MDTELSEQRVDQVSVYINAKLALLSPTHSGHCIFRVPNQLRKENEGAYEPIMLAIGPYHHGKNNLKAMEEHKFRYLQQVLHLSNESIVDRYVLAMKDLEERARNCYAESFNLDSDEFVKMLLLDGCFVIHFFRKCGFEDIRYIYPNDPILRDNQTFRSILLDLMLFENQLPFFVLDRLFDMLKSPDPRDNIRDLVLRRLMVLFPSGSNASEISLRASTNNVHHILGLVHGVWCSSFAEVLSQRKPENLKEDWEVIKCTTELQEAGVKFKKSSQTEIPFFDIKFENGVIEIPPLFISDDTERIFRNLIAYEQCSMSTCKKYFAHYSNFMDCLINSAKDVEKLRHKGIIVNALGDDEAVSSMFNKLCNHVMFTEPNYYSEVFENLNIHCGQRRNIWLANLRRNYFYSPWSVISFIAAAMLILFTFTQTIFSFLSYFKSKP